MQLKYVIIRDTENTFTINQHYHNCFELVYYHKAKGYSYWSETKQNVQDDFVFVSKPTEKQTKFSFGNNTLVVIPPYILHNEVHFIPTKLTALGFETFGDDFLHPLKSVLSKPIIIQDKDKVIEKQLIQIEQEFAEQQPFFEKIITNLIKRSLAIAIEPLQNADSSQKQIELAKQYLDEYFHTTIDYKKIADMCGYSFDHFRFLFKKTTGFSPRAYVTEKRFETAKQLLSKTNLPLIDISKECGFENYLQFNRLFNTTLGISPSEYRATHAQQQPITNLNNIK